MRDNLDATIRAHGGADCHAVYVRWLRGADRFVIPVEKTFPRSPHSTVLADVVLPRVSVQPGRWVKGR